MGSRRTAGGLPGLLAFAMSMVFVAPSAAAPAPGDCVVTPADQLVDSVELELATLVNDYRVQNGRARLVMHQDLTRSAAWFSRSMASGNYFPLDHVDANGRTIPQRFTWCGVRYNAWRENIAAHTSGLAIDVFNLWVNSPPHNTNMLAADVRSMGIARAFDASSDFDYYFTLTLSDSVPIPPADFDDSGTGDIAVFRPSSGGWFIRGQAGALWGQNGDIPVPGDYDGNGTTDIAVYRPGSAGGWFIRGQAGALWGATGDIPVPGDYDGNGTTDIAVYRPSSGGWFVRGQAGALWGQSGDYPVPGDYDGNGTTDMTVYRPGNPAGWYIRNQAGTVWGTTGDIPLSLPAAVRSVFFP